MADRGKAGMGMKKATRTRRYNQEPAGKRVAARAQRDDTPEARRQKNRAPKTHPTRASGQIGARRKDKGSGGTGGGAPAAPTQAVRVRVPANKRRGASSRGGH